MSRRPSLQLLALEDRLAPAIATWDGGGANPNWSTAANWVGDVAPHAGDDLNFVAGPTALVAVNDFAAGTVFHSIGISGAGYQISGNALALVTGVGCGVPAGGSATLGLAIGGAGGLIKSSAGTIVLSGANSYTGATLVAEGTLEVRSNSALGAMGTGNFTTVSDGATLALNGISLTIAESISFAGRGVDGVVGAIAEVAGSNVLGGALTMTGNALIAGVPGTNNQLLITTGIGETGGARDLELKVRGLGLIFNVVAVNTYTGRTTVSGDVVFDGRANGPVTVTGNLIGTGTLGAVQVTTGELFPGVRGDASHNATSGTLTVGGLDESGGTTEIILSRTVATQLVVQGGVRVGGALAVSLQSDINGHPLFLVRPDDAFKIVDNDGTDGVVGTFDGLPEGALLNVSPPVPLRISYHGGDGNDVVLVGVSQTASAVGAGVGGSPTVRVYDGAGGLVRSFLAYPAGFTGGVHVAVGDVTGDGVPDIVTAPGFGGGPVVRIWDGATGSMVREFNAYDPNFRGGAFVASADIDADGRKDIITGAGAGGGPHVEVFSGMTGAVLSSFLAYDPRFLGGVSVAATDGANVPIAHVHYNGTIITGAGPGGGPHVRTFDGITGVGYGSFFAYAPTFSGGVNVAVGQFGSIDTGGPNIVTAPASAGGPDVRVYNAQGQQLASFFAYSPAFLGGVTVAVQPIGVGGSSAILTGAGPGGGPHVEQWEFPGPVVRRSFFAFDSTFLGGVFVG